MKTYEFTPSLRLFQMVIKGLVCNISRKIPEIENPFIGILGKASRKTKSTL